MVQNKIKSILFTGLAAISLSSCERIFMEEDLASKDPMSNFERLWNECDEKYSYFDLKNIDWNQIKEEYSQRIYSDMPDDSLFDVLGDMLTELRDDHSNLISEFNISFFGVDYLGQDNFDFRAITDFYIGRDYYVSGPFIHNYLDSNEIGYVRYSSFSNSISTESLDYVINRYKDTKGLIFDIRENGGGRIDNVYTILSRFIDSPQTIYYTRIKSGTEHNDFTEAEEVILTPSSSSKYLKPIIVLTDRGSYSASSMFSLASKALPNMTLLGDTTGGGLGMPNGGQLPNGWNYRFSITQCLDLNKNEAFENGVPPDEIILYDWNNLETDEILERAKYLIHQNNN